MATKYGSKRICCKNRFHLCLISNKLTLDKPLAIRICCPCGDEGLHWISFKSACGHSTLLSGYNSTVFVHQLNRTSRKIHPAYKENVSLPRLATLSNVVLYFRELLVEAPEIFVSGREKTIKASLLLVQAGFELPAAKVSYLQVQDPGCLSHDPREAHPHADTSRHRLPAAAGANPSVSIKV